MNQAGLLLHCFSWGNMKKHLFTDRSPVQTDERVPPKSVLRLLTGMALKQLHHLAGVTAGELHPWSFSLAYRKLHWTASCPVPLWVSIVCVTLEWGLQVCDLPESCKSPSSIFSPGGEKNYIDLQNPPFKVWFGAISHSIMHSYHCHLPCPFSSPYYSSLLSFLTDPFILFMSFHFVLWPTEFNRNHLCDHGLGVIHWCLGCLSSVNPLFTATVFSMGSWGRTARPCFIHITWYYADYYP